MICCRHKSRTITRANAIPHPPMKRGARGGFPGRVKISNQNFLARSSGLSLVVTDLYYVDVRKL